MRRLWEAVAEAALRRRWEAQAAVAELPLGQALTVAQAVLVGLPRQAAVPRHSWVA